MFSLNDDFEIEEDFLEEVFKVEKDALEKEKSPVISHVSPVGPSVPVSDSINRFHTPVRPSTSFCRPSTSKDLSTSIDLFADSTVSNQKHLVTTKINKSVRQRKFPGPAGLLPERHHNSSFSSNDDLLSELHSEADNQKESSFEETVIYSQDTTREYECGCWAAMTDDLGHGGKRLLEVVNLKSLRANVKYFKSAKVPFLAVVIQSVDCSSPDPALLLKDPYGEMHGTLHRGVWEEYSDELNVSSVLVLRSVGVVCPGVSSKRIYLNITANNLLSIYSSQPSDENIKVSKLNPSVKCEPNQILKDWSSILSSLPSQSSKKPAAGPLFTSLVPSPSPCPPRPPMPLQPRRQPADNRRLHRPSLGHRPPAPLASGGKRPLGALPQPPPLTRPIHSHFLKKPKVETSKSGPDHCPPSPSVVVTPKGPLPALDSLFEGIDTDSLFGDF